MADTFGGDLFSVFDEEGETSSNKNKDSYSKKG